MEDKPSALFQIFNGCVFNFSLQKAIVLELSLPVFLRERSVVRFPCLVVTGDLLQAVILNFCVLQY
jgi:hypothetical protein